ncbi:hypothetical protein KCP74_20900 [Salmonella enterica subsp. enterica]|nr:hypothetical protein KCP74_20900 [Salmonella enterica subsp. enterica]
MVAAGGDGYCYAPFLLIAFIDANDTSRRFLARLSPTLTRRQTRLLRLRGYQGNISKLPEVNREQHQN